jgi:hypothetical protein
MSDKPRMHQIMRYIGKSDKSNPKENVYSGAEIDEYVSSWLNKGYKIVNTHYLGDNIEGYGMLYVLEMV